jgi:hypothetical protein
MILTHESGSQEDQFDGKKEDQKSRGTIPLSLTLLAIIIAQYLSLADFCSTYVINTHKAR